jgi:hypothetical protein
VSSDTSCHRLHRFSLADHSHHSPITPLNTVIAEVSGASPVGCGVFPNVEVRSARRFMICAATCAGWPSIEVLLGE